MASSILTLKQSARRTSSTWGGGSATRYAAVPLATATIIVSPTEIWMRRSKMALRPLTLSLFISWRYRSYSGWSALNPYVATHSQYPQLVSLHPLASLPMKGRFSDAFMALNSPSRCLRGRHTWASMCDCFPRVCQTFLPSEAQRYTP